MFHSAVFITMVALLAQVPYLVQLEIALFAFLYISAFKMQKTLYILYYTREHVIVPHYVAPGPCTEVEFNLIGGHFGFRTNRMDFLQLFQT